MWKKCYFWCVIVKCSNMDLTTHLVFIWVIPFTWSGDWCLKETDWSCLRSLISSGLLKQNRFCWTYFLKIFSFTQSPSVVVSNVTLCFIYASLYSVCGQSCASAGVLPRACPAVRLYSQPICSPDCYFKGYHVIFSVSFFIRVTW